MHALCTATAFLSTALCAAAAVLGTLHQPATGYEVVSYNTWQATSFSLAATAASYRVRHVSLHIAQVVPNAHLVLRITGSALGRPDNADVRAVLRLPATLPTAPGAVTFTASASPDPLLLPGQTYWLVLGITALDHDEPLPAGLARWSYAATSAADSPGAAGWSVGCCTASSGTGGEDWQPAANTPCLFAISARPPGALAPAAPGITSTGGVIQVTARGTPGVDYDIEFTTGLASWTGLGSAFADAAGIIRFTDPAGLPRRFYRFQ